MVVDGIEYIKKSEVNSLAKNTQGLSLVMIRTQNAGVFYGYLESRKSDEVELIKARRVYYWNGAATLSELSQSGTSKPDSCKFPEEVKRITLIGVIEIIPITSKAEESLSRVKTWKA